MSWVDFISWKGQDPLQLFFILIAFQFASLLMVVSVIISHRYSIHPPYGKVKQYSTTNTTVLDFIDG